MEKDEAKCSSAKKIKNPQLKKNEGNEKHS
jgi:hypothetical protein